ncbi:hypothetical protein CDIK_1928 [Cucumispora dikerogammari]|nr:hypothetical protein CDIK_1928 [Cucumispora dikerogammari]
MLQTETLEQIKEIKEDELMEPRRINSFLWYCFRKDKIDVHYYTTVPMTMKEITTSIDLKIKQKRKIMQPKGWVNYFLVNENIQSFPAKERAREWMECENKKIFEINALSKEIVELEKTFSVWGTIWKVSGSIISFLFGWNYLETKQIPL